MSPEERTPRDRRSFATFSVVWFCETLSILGSALTGFALGVWAYKTTGSVTAYALIALATVAPSVLFSPAAGSLVDRWDRRKAMIFGDLGAGVGTLVLAVLFWAGAADLLPVCLVLAVCSLFGTVQSLAFTASTRLLVPERHLGRANGMAHLGPSAARILAPLLAGVMVETVGIHVIILIDVGTLVMAVTTLLFVRIPSPAREVSRGGGWRQILRDARQGLDYVVGRHGLLAMLGMFTIVNLCVGMVQTLLPPLVLSFASAAELGRVLSVTGVGMLGGGLVMVAWGARGARLVPAILSLLAVQGSLLLLGGVRPSIPLVATAAFVYVFCTPIISSCSLTLWQRKVPAALQGRVFALNRMVSMSAMPVAYMVAGPLADGLFEPWLAPGGALAGSLGAVIGVGPGRGIGLLFVLLGLVLVCTAAIAFSFPPLRRLETEIPDADVETSAAVDARPEEKKVVKAVLVDRPLGEQRQPHRVAPAVRVFDRPLEGWRSP